MLVSVIVPIYNVETYIEECVESVIWQTYSAIEIILVDNNSTDGSLQKIQNLSKHYPQIKILREARQGACFARNTGLRAAVGEYIQFLDADDLLMPDKIERQVALLRNTDSKPALVIAAYRKVLPDGKIADVTVEHSDVWFALMTTTLGCTCSNLWRRSALKFVGGWNENYRSSQEYELMFRLLKTDPVVVFDDHIGTVVRVRSSGNISTQNTARNWRTYSDLRYAIISFQRKEKRMEVPDHYWQVLFDSIRILYKHDRTGAIERYKEYLTGKFKPKASKSTSQSYLFFYKIFGFKGAEQIRTLIGK